MQPITSADPAKSVPVKLSIVTVTYNAAGTLESAILSVIPQLNAEIEYIIIDGGSKDHTAAIIQKHERHLAFWCSEPDKGIYDAWNKGISHAKGEYISFIGADDLLLPGACRQYLDYAKNNPEIEFISSRVKFGSDALRIIGEPWSWRSFRRYMNVAHVGSLHKKTLFTRGGRFDCSYRIAGDYEFLLRAGSKLKAGYIDAITVQMGDGGISNNRIGLALKETMRAKIANHAVSGWVAAYDIGLARIKWLLRKLFERLPL